MSGNTRIFGTIIKSGSIPTTALSGGVVSSSVQIVNALPGGTISSSVQIANELPTNVVSSSTQVTAFLPIGTVSSSTQLPSGTVSSSAQVKDYLPTDTVSSSVQVTAFLPVGTVSSSTQVDFNTISNKPTLVSASSQINAFDTVGGNTLATTGSNTFTGITNFSNTTNTTSYLDGAVHLDGGMSIQKDLRISGSMTINGLLTVVSMSSQYVTSSQYNVGVSKITLNDDDNVRFAGISIVDSGSSSPATASIYWDSLQHRFIYENLSGSAYNSAILIAGPKNNGALGSESELTTGYIPYATGGDHIDNSVMYQSASNVGIGTTTPSSKLDVFTGASYITVATSDGVGSSGGFGFNFRIVNSSHDIARILGSYENSGAGGSGGLVFSTRESGTVTERWVINSTGTLSSNGAQTIQTSTGNLTLATAGGNGHILLTPNGTGKIGIGTTNPSVVLDVIGTTSGSLRLSNTASNTTNKLGRVVGRQYTNTDADFLAFDIRGLSTLTEINYGGGSSLLNAVMAHKFYTAENNTTLGGTPRLVINPSGSIGIGTDNPSYKVDIQGSAPVLAIADTGTSEATLFGLVNGGSNGVGALRFVNGGNLLFDNGATGAAQSTKMYISAVGHVGVGVTPEGWTSDFKVLRVGAGQALFSTSAPNARMTANTYNNGAWRFIANGRATQYEQDGYHAWYISSGSNTSGFGAPITWTQAMTLDNVGNLGIGTNNPVQKLHVEGSPAIGTTGTEDILVLGRAVSTAVSFQQAASFKLGRYQNAGGAYESFTRLDIALKDNTAASNYNTNTTVMTLTNAGYVGIGTTNPQGALHVVSSNVPNAHYNNQGAIFFQALEPQIQIIAEDVGSHAGKLAFTNAPGSGDNKHWMIDHKGPSLNNRFDISYFTTSAGGNILSPSGAEKVSITTDGKVGIGNTNPNHTLDVAGEIAIRGGESADDARMYFQASDYSNRFTIETDLAGDTNDDLLGFRSNTTDNILVLKGNGNIGIGKTNPSVRLDVSGSIYATTGAYTTSMLGYTGGFGALTAGGMIWTPGNYPLQLLGDSSTGGTSSGVKILYYNQATWNYALNINNISGGGYGDLLLMQAGGNVAIGTTGAVEKLEVNGTNVSVAVYDNNMTVGGNRTRLKLGHSNNYNAGLSGYVASGQPGIDRVSLGFHVTTYTSAVQTFYEAMTLTDAGNLLPGTNGTQNLGSSSLRWSTVYTSDLSLSNGIGDWTIVEGEDDLFIYNNKNNKVYKFTLQEVDPTTATPKKS